MLRERRTTSQHDQRDGCRRPFRARRQSRLAGSDAAIARENSSMLANRAARSSASAVRIAASSAAEGRGAGRVAECILP